jgi:putative DNA primase/helicase
MSALDTIDRILLTTLATADLRYCLVTDNKRPIKIDGTPAKPNVESDFVKLDELLLCTSIDSYAGVGISIQASNMCAIDVDHCFSVPRDLASADSRAIDVLNRFDKIAYCEFSFSGKGLRVLFKQPVIENYSDKYYIKNEKFGIEFYQPTKSFRYVTVTGNVIANNQLGYFDTDSVKMTIDFLDTYMQRAVRKQFDVKTEADEIRSFEELMRLVKITYFKNMIFQNAWFAHAPGSGKDESERDFYLISFLYENITQDKELLRQIFESSPYFKSKDSHHVYKWTNQDHRYYNYIYSTIRRQK